MKWFNKTSWLKRKQQIRTRCYQKAIEENPELFKDKVVLDIGCGTGILSIFAAKAGAKHVYGIEYATIAYKVNTLFKKKNASKIKGDQGKRLKKSSK